MFVQHVQLHIASLGIGLRNLPLRLATVTVVRRPNASELDWEIVAHTIEPEPVAATTHSLRMDVIVGADDDGRLVLQEMFGTAALVRRVELAVVFRGTSSLDGFDPALLGPTIAS